MGSDDLNPFDLELQNFTCDLLALAKYQPALQRLFQARKGNWVRLTDLCATVPELADTYRPIHERLAEDLFAAWLDDPFAETRQGYALVTFYLDELAWGKTALFNRGTLPKTARRKPAKQVQTER